MLLATDTARYLLGFSCGVDKSIFLLELEIQSMHNLLNLHPFFAATHALIFTEKSPLLSKIALKFVNSKSLKFFPLTANVLDCALVSVNV